MGWITDKRNKTGRGIGGNPHTSARSKAPLRAIVEILETGKGMFDRDWVLLECGHEIYSKGIYKARCTKCLTQHTIKS